VADDKIQWQLEIDGKGALDTLDKVKSSAKEIDLSTKTLRSLDMMVRSLLETHRMASQVADAVKMERRERQDNLRIAERQKQVERDRAESAAKAAKTERENALSGLRNVAIGSGLGALAMVKGMAGSGFSDTLQGQQAQVYGQLLNRQVASIFAPLLEEKTKYVAQMTQWLQGLDAPQRESIRQMTVFATSLGALGYVVPKITKGIAAALEIGIGGTGAQSAATMVGTGAVAGRAAGAAAATRTDLMAMAGPIGLGIAGILAAASATERGRQSLIELGKSAESLAEKAAPAATGAINFITDNFEGLSDILKGEFKWYNFLPFGTGRQVAQLFGMNVNERDATKDGGLSPVPKGLEDIGRDYERIFEAATKIDLQQRQVNLLEQIATNTGRPLVQMPPPGLQGAVGLNNLIGF